MKKKNIYIILWLFLLCFYVNEHPGDINTHATSCGKWVLFGVIAVGMDLQNHLLIKKGLEFCYTNLCMVISEKKKNKKNLHLGSMERTWERGKNHPEQFLFLILTTFGWPALTTSFLLSCVLPISQDKEMRTAAAGIFAITLKTAFATTTTTKIIHLQQPSAVCHQHFQCF